MKKKDRGTIRNRYPLPEMDDLIDQLQEAAWLLKLIFVRSSEFRMQSYVMLAGVVPGTFHRPISGTKSCLLQRSIKGERRATVLKRDEARASIGFLESSNWTNSFVYCVKGIRGDHITCLCGLRSVGVANYLSVGTLSQRGQADHFGSTWSTRKENGWKSTSNPPPRENTIKIADDKDRGIREYVTPEFSLLNSSVLATNLTAQSFEPKQLMFTMLGTIGQFSGHNSDDPHLHLRSYLEVVDSFRARGVDQETMRLLFFTYSLKDKAKDWLSSQPPHSITSWDDLVTKFLKKYFPPTRNAKLRNAISMFSQEPDESVSDAWERYKDLLRKCPHHGIPHCIQWSWVVVEKVLPKVSGKYCSKFELVRKRHKCWCLHFLVQSQKESMGPHLHNSCPFFKSSKSLPKSSQSTS
ncbi:hypothetical protein OSB04_018998 [Centaurea solstitialis]|uniref:Retrotransposon gag domain-containing protein n=1 Tax=Centaurea solstitialis TaxID=347529 RepID=A0AA38WBY8_9ASTR|nr:hypothetical protein OSB04_018998 [Centaurea solstitialis]